ncbi:MAG: MFS transporter [Eubacterium sp.]|nr:MFS transporter [Eubacterium sp.]
MKKTTNYNHTIYASYIGYITQAIVNNFAPLLFITFSREFSLTLDKIALITTVNFAVQLTVDLLSSKLVDKIGYRICIVAAHVFSAVGLLALALLPSVLSVPYAGILVAVVLYAIGGGLIEVLISPIVEACPTAKKEAAMSLLHSFYCWGHVGVVLLSALFFRLFGVENWRVLAVIWAAVPTVNCFFFATVPLYPITGDAPSMSVKALFRQKIFWLLMVMMVCAGAAEQAMSQWASAFAESVLGVSKTVGDLAGPCAFALLMGTSRALYAKAEARISLRKAMLLSALLCIAAYLAASLTQLPAAGLAACAVCGFSVGIFWPGTFSLAAKKLPLAGTAMYAFMALAGDVGCSGGPTLVGMVANAVGGNLKIGLLAAVVFPVLIVLCVAVLKKQVKQKH